MASISFHSILDGVSLAVKSAFPEAQVFGGNVKQGLRPGDFNVIMLSASQNKQVGRRFARSPLLDVLYYPKCGALECCSVADPLAMALQNITTPEGDVIHCTSNRLEIVDGVLHMQVQYDHHIYSPQERTSMETLNFGLGMEESL